MSKKKIVALIQARMGSSRLPGKILMDINGRPMLWHVFSRLRRCHLLDDVVIVTTSESKDDDVESFCRLHQISCFRGSEQDVLDRYYQAAIACKADIIVRITADCPLIDPVITDKVINAFLSHPGGYCGAANIIERTYPRGLDTEVFVFPAVETAWKTASMPHHREHVTSFLYEHPEFFQVLSVKQDKDLSGMRWTVDETDDLHFINEVYRLMKKKGLDFFDYNDVVVLLAQHPALCKLNASVMQKKIH